MSENQKYMVYPKSNVLMKLIKKEKEFLSKFKSKGKNLIPQATRGPLIPNDFRVKDN